MVSLSESVVVTIAESDAAFNAQGNSLGNFRDVPVRSHAPAVLITVRTTPQSVAWASYGQRGCPAAIRSRSGAAPTKAAASPCSKLMPG